MRNIIFISFMVLFAACSKKKDSAKPTTTTSSIDKGFITWMENKTLHPDGIYSTLDSIYVYKSGDTSIATYRGVKYYIWWAVGGTYIENTKTFTDSTDQWLNCFLSAAPFDTIGFHSRCAIANKEYWNVDLNTWNAFTGFSIQFFDTAISGVLIGHTYQ